MSFVFVVDMPNGIKLQDPDRGGSDAGGLFLAYPVVTHSH
jgi:hypothetical protein